MERQGVEGWGGWGAGGGVTSTQCSLGKVGTFEQCQQGQALRRARLQVPVLVPCPQFRMEWEEVRNPVGAEPVVRRQLT